MGARGDEGVEAADGGFGVARPVAEDDERFVACWVGFEGVGDVVAGDFAVDEVAWVEGADEVLLEDVVNVSLFVDGENLPVGVDDTANGAQDYFAAGVVGDPVGDVVDFGVFDYPAAFGRSAVVFDFGEADCAGGGRSFSVCAWSLLEVCSCENAQGDGSGEGGISNKRWWLTEP